jgi:hypothetical protein
MSEVVIGVEATVADVAIEEASGVAGAVKDALFSANHHWLWPDVRTVEVTVTVFEMSGSSQPAPMAAEQLSRERFISRSSAPRLRRHERRMKERMIGVIHLTI